MNVCALVWENAAEARLDLEARKLSSLRSPAGVVMSLRREMTQSRERERERGPLSDQHGVCERATHLSVRVRSGGGGSASCSAVGVAPAISQ